MPLYRAQLEQLFIWDDTVPSAEDLNIGWQYEEILAAPEKFGVSDKVKILENVPDTDLDVFYQHALCYVLPSLYEGFGLPVLEAMPMGEIVRISDRALLTSALAEPNRAQCPLQRI